MPDYTDIKLIPRRREGAHVLVAGPDIGKKGGSTFRIFDLWVAPQKAPDASGPVLKGVLRAVGRWADFVGDPKTRDQAVRFAVEWGGKMSGKALNKADIEATMEGAHFYDSAGQKQIVDSGISICRLPSLVAPSAYLENAFRMQLCVAMSSKQT